MDEFAEALREVQNRLGEEPTMLPRRRDVPSTPDRSGEPEPADRTIARPQARRIPRRPETPTNPAAAAPAVPVASALAGGTARFIDGERPTGTGEDRFGDDGTAPGEQTVRRMRRTPPTAKRVDRDLVDVDAVPSSNRRRVATALGVVAVVGVVLTLALGGRGGDESSPSTTVLVAEPPVDADPNAFAQLSPPERVAVRVGEDDAVEVSFDAVDAAVRYRLNVVGVPSLGDDVDADPADSRVVVATGVAPSLGVCWTVQSIGANGTLSADSAPACVPA
jgi:hypothetical protein